MRQQNLCALALSCSAILSRISVLRDIFTLVGDHLNDVLLSAKRKGFRIVDMRHESGVVHAADTYARATRRPALALVTGGPGHTNALTGMATANLIGSPVIAVSGSRPLGQAYRGAFQDVEQVGSARPLVKWAAEGDTARTDSTSAFAGMERVNEPSPRRGTSHNSRRCPDCQDRGGTQCSCRRPFSSSSLPCQIDRAVSLLRVRRAAR